MNLMDMLSNAGANQAIAGKFGLDQNQTQAVIGKLLPALGAGLKKNTAQPGGLEALTRALQNGGHSRYLQKPAELAGTGAIQDGNAILGHILGSKDVSRGVAARAAEGTGVDVGVVKQMLPMVAAALMGAMGQQQQAPGGNVAGLLGSFLDGNKDGSVADDLLGLAGKFFGR
jgi:hypothetical protein